jgi:hypothetical protein
MVSYKRKDYELLLSYNPCEIFDYYEVDKMHGLNKISCEEYNNTTEDAYFAGWCNFIPNTPYKFVFINLSRCTDEIHTFGLIMHELMHQSFDKFDEDLYMEEEMITWAEEQAYEVYEIVNKNLKQNK